MFRLIVSLRRAVSQLWMRVALHAVLALVAVALAHAASALVPDWLNARIGPEAVLPVLSVLASSMLAVSTFSLGTMVAAHRAAADSATPRVHQMLLADGTTQAVLSVFIGAFVYALTALILFHAGFDGGAPVVLGVTLLVTGWVVVALIRWIGHLATLGTVQDALDRAEAAARQALTALAEAPALGATPLGADSVIADDAHSVAAPVSGVVQMIDVAGLAACLPGPVWVLHRPGDTVLAGQPLLRFAGEAAPEGVTDCFVIGHTRTLEQDPVLAVETLAEIGQRALSPAVNDPGTATAVIARLLAVLWDFGETAEGRDPPVPEPRVFLPPVPASALVEAGLGPLARDGAGMLEVARPLLRALDALCGSRNADLARAAQATRLRARAHAETALTLEAERRALALGDPAAPLARQDP